MSKRNVRHREEEARKDFLAAKATFRKEEEEYEDVKEDLAMAEISLRERDA